MAVGRARVVPARSEDNNPEARALYERLDYHAHGQEPASWEHEDHDGRLVLYETTVTLLHKRL